jgi:uncharacterized glyoxalase superfamily protein PhnB
VGDAGSYAEHEGIGVDEASQRFRITDSAGRLQADLAAHEAETFGGLWIEHSLEFKIVVMFTANLEQTIQPYLGKDYMTKEVADIMVRVYDIDRHYEHVKESGAAIVNPPADYPYGERQYTLDDIGGHHWTFSQTIADVDPESWGGILLKD